MASGGTLNKTSVLRYNPDRGNSSNDWSDPDDFRGADTVQFFCDADAANDSADGLTSSTPKKTTAAIMALVKAAQIAFPGRPDQVLFKCGTTGTYAALGVLTVDGDVGHQPLDGRSNTQRLVFGTYGVGARPVFSTGSTTPIVFAINNFATSVRGNRNLAFLGLEFVTTATHIISVEGDFNSVLIENCKFNETNISIDMSSVSGPYVRRDLVIRRSTFVDAHINFIRLIRTDGVLIEENFFDNIIVATAGTNSVNIRRSRCIEAWVGAYNTEVTGNTFTNFGYRGMWFGSGAIVHSNIFVGGLVAIHFGNNWEQPETSSPFGNLAVHGGGYTLCDVVGNYVGEGKNIYSLDGTAFTGPMGVYIQNVGPGASPRPRVANNIIARSSGSGSNFGIYINGTGSNGAGLGCGVRGIIFQGNKVFKWYTGAAGQNFSGRALEIAGWNIQQTGMMIYDLDFINNDLQEPIAHQGSILRMDPSLNLGAFPRQYEGGFNRFWRTGNNLLYSVSGGGDSDLNGYRQYTADLTSFETQVPYPDPDKTIGDYNGTIGGTATLAGFVADMRAQHRGNWDDRLMAEAALVYFNSNFDA